MKMGPGGAKALLAAGCNDMGGSLMNESITRAAGASHGTSTCFSPACMYCTLLYKNDRQPMISCCNSKWTGFKEKCNSEWIIIESAFYSWIGR